ncbi:unnamed protein product [Arabis nemorensis]|uniref:Uncharacterized protein n=1 Tax=Arabis nemorensis TaxID=586526 RepID=A0A565CPG4_9BRAS|nr:unnamed protein product [Arabis nemorensis]
MSKSQPLCSVISAVFFHGVIATLISKFSLSDFVGQDSLRISRSTWIINSKFMNHVVDNTVEVNGNNKTDIGMVRWHSTQMLYC